MRFFQNYCHLFVFAISFFTFMQALTATSIHIDHKFTYGKVKTKLMLSHHKLYINIRGHFLVLCINFPLYFFCQAHWLWFHQDTQPIVIGDRSDGLTDSGIKHQLLKYIIPGRSLLVLLGNNARLCI